MEKVLTLSSRAIERILQRVDFVALRSAMEAASVTWQFDTGARTPTEDELRDRLASLLREQHTVGGVWRGGGFSVSCGGEGALEVAFRLYAIDFYPNGTAVLE